MKIRKEFMNLLVKLSPGDLNRQDEPRIQGESWKRTKSPCAAAASIRKATNGEYNTFLNIVSENLSLIKYRSDQLNKNQVCRLLSSLEAK